MSKTHKQPLLEGGEGKTDDDVMNNERLKAVKEKMNMLAGYEGAWIHLRRNNCYYIMNKVISMIIAITFAIITIAFKQTTQAYVCQIKNNG